MAPDINGGQRSSKSVGNSSKSLGGHGRSTQRERRNKTKASQSIASYKIMLFCDEESNTKKSFNSSRTSANWSPCEVSVFPSRILFGYWKNLHDPENFKIEETSRDLSSIQMIIRHSGHPKTLVLRWKSKPFRLHANGDMVLSFKNVQEKEKFCKQVYIQSENSIVVQQDGEYVFCQKEKSVGYEVEIITGTRKESTSTNTGKLVLSSANPERGLVLYKCKNKETKPLKVLMVVPWDYIGEVKAMKHPEDKRRLILSFPQDVASMVTSNASLLSHLDYPAEPIDKRLRYKKENDTPEEALLRKSQDLLTTNSSAKQLCPCTTGVGSRTFEEEDIIDFSDIEPALEDEWMICFQTVQARERFLARLRGIVKKVINLEGFRKNDFDETKLRKTNARTEFVDGISIQIATWNTGSSTPPSNITELGGWIRPDKYDMYVIGLQESSRDWLKVLAKHLNCESEEGNEVKASKYVVLDVVTMLEIHLIVIARRSLKDKIYSVKKCIKKTGFGNMVGNKGAVAVAVNLRDSTSLCFVCTHLAAQSENIRKRESNYVQICKCLDFSISTEFNQERAQFLHDFDHVFWFGDLNYRIDLGNAGTKTEFTDVVNRAKNGEWEDLLRADQLIQQRRLNRVFCGFHEGPIRFAPTYRMLKGKHGYSNKKDQNPSFTDRVLWRSRCGNGTKYIEQASYYACHELNDQKDPIEDTENRRSINKRFSCSTSPPIAKQLHDYCPSLFQSDHRPVGACFNLKPRPEYTLSEPESLFMDTSRCRIYLANLSLQMHEADEDMNPFPEPTKCEEYIEGEMGKCFQCGKNQPLTKFSAKHSKLSNKKDGGTLQLYCSTRCRNKSRLRNRSRSSTLSDPAKFRVGETQLAAALKNIGKGSIRVQASAWWCERAIQISTKVGDRTHSDSKKQKPKHTKKHFYDSVLGANTTLVPFIADPDYLSSEIIRMKVKSITTTGGQSSIGFAELPLSQAILDAEASPDESVWSNFSIPVLLHGQLVGTLNGSISVNFFDLFNDLT